VSCTSAAACTAVGHYVDSGGVEVTLAEAWNGKRWAIKATPNPKGAKSSSLLGVSCTSAAACTAVGEYVDSGGVEVTLAEAWNGKRWAIKATPNPKGAKSSSLFGVSCTSAAACTAVGDHVKSAPGNYLLLAEFWNGKTWAIKATPNPKGAYYGALDAVSCSSASACTAVGSYLNDVQILGTLAESWNGKRWTFEPSPNPTAAKEGAGLGGVSCTSTTACTAVGLYYNGHGVPLKVAETWNGKKWTIEATPNPKGAIETYFYEVSCTSVTACTAVGGYTVARTALVGLAEAWNGKKWAIEATPSPPDSEGGNLLGVSCKSATACSAVGYYYIYAGAGPPHTLAEAWNGKRWTVESTPSP
jgi:hypothetical protein